MDSSKEELIIALASYIICLGSHFIDTQNKLHQRATKRRHCWVSHTNSKRSKFGAYHSTMAQLEVSQAKEWRNYMRMDKNLFTSLLQSISADISKQDTNCRLAIPPSERLAVTLRYLATGESFTSLHYQFRMGISTIAQVVPEVCKAIFTCLKDEYLKTPNTAIQWKAISEEYFNMWNFPHCLGSLDGKHIVMRKPWHAGSVYHNYKGTESIVLMAIVDARYRYRLDLSLT